MPENRDHLHQDGEQIGARQVAGFEPRLEAVDMPTSEIVGASDPLAGFLQIGKELGQGDGIGLHGRTDAERSTGSGEMTKRARECERKAARLQPRIVDQGLAAALRDDCESQPSDRIDVIWDCNALFGTENHSMAFAGTAGHDALTVGTSASNSSTAASTVSARAAI